MFACPPTRLVSLASLPAPPLVMDVDEQAHLACTQSALPSHTPSCHLILQPLHSLPVSMHMHTQATIRIPEPHLLSTLPPLAPLIHAFLGWMLLRRHTDLHLGNNPNTFTLPSERNPLPSPHSHTPSWDGCCCAGTLTCTQATTQMPAPLSFQHTPSSCVTPTCLTGVDAQAH